MILDHPCFDEKAHFLYGRIHLPVAETCNIHCKYCSREVGISYHGCRPGVAERILTPDEAVERVSSYMDPTLKVAGIAGPGEPLYNKDTFETLELIHEKFSHLILCVATNGLLLPEKAELLAQLGVKTVTVTISTVKVEIIPKIYLHIMGEPSEKTAEQFIISQLKGIEACTELDMRVKVNSVLIPGVTTEGLKDVAVQSRKRGAYMQNIVPLIPLAGYKEVRPPTCEELQSARNKCQEVLPQFRLCRQCRADAVGIPGKSNI
ncbi:MAG: radical SAM protein [Candidatus Methanofastidiosia archaeon]